MLGVTPLRALSLNLCPEFCHLHLEATKWQHLPQNLHIFEPCDFGYGRVKFLCTSFNLASLSYYHRFELSSVQFVQENVLDKDGDGTPIVVI
jgi:hypothetical protein